MIENYYPESPNINKDVITKVTSQYRSQVIVNLLAIALFFILFLAMIAGAGYLAYLSAMYPLRTDFTKWDILLKIGLVAMSVMLFGFLLKFLFKKHSTENPLHVEITEQEHPRLFEFIRKLSKEVGAPFPKKVFVNHEINAAVFYNSTVLSLFFPVKKNLLIGLGLVNSINLTEFKAVLAHEFGHFAQSSMKLGSYVYMANSIIYDMVNERDRWDDLLERWKKMDFRFAVFGWILSPIIWLVRLFMSLLYKAMNLLHSSLSRQMEYNADLVAVSVTGSNNIISGLYKIGLTGQSYNFTFGQLQTANDQNIYTNDLFFNHRKCHEYLEKNNSYFKEHIFSNKVTEPLSNYQLFDKDEGAGSGMYASHPSDFKREQNAKANFVEGVVDDRSPWELFDNPDTLAEKVTQNLYEVSEDSNRIEFIPKEAVQDFIYDELSESDYHERYKGFFDLRTLNISPKDSLKDILERQAISEENLLTHLKALWDDSFKNKMDSVLEKNDKLIELITLAQSQDKNGSVEIQGQSFGFGELQTAHEKVMALTAEDDDWFNAKHEQLFAIYTLLNQRYTPDDTELSDRYIFTASVNILTEQLSKIEQPLEEAIGKIIEMGEVADSEVKVYADKFFSLKQQMEDLVRNAKTVQVPILGNIGDLQKLGQYLVNGKVAFIPITTLDFDRVQEFREQVQDAGTRLKRLYEKNLGLLLKKQEALEAEAGVQF